MKAAFNGSPPKNCKQRKNIFILVVFRHSASLPLTDSMQQISS